MYVSLSKFWDREEPFLSEPGEPKQYPRLDGDSFRARARIGSGSPKATPYGSFPKIRGAQYSHPSTASLIVGTPKQVPLILENSHI